MLGKCDSCGLVFVLNPPGVEELANIYSFSKGYHSSFQDEGSADFHNHRKIAVQHYRFMRSCLNKGKILDVGCSVGCLLQLAEQDGWEAWGTELSADTAAIGIKNGLKIVASSFDDFNHGGAPFDVITMWDVFEHLPNPVDAARKANGLLKPGGLLIVSTPNIDGAFPKFAYRISKLTKTWPHPEPPHHLFQFSAATAARLLRQAGFSICRVVHERIALKYSFREQPALLRSPRALAYALLCMPVALIAPFFNSGDSITIVAKKGR